MTKEQIEQKLAQLDEQRQQALAHVHFTNGAIAAYREMLAALAPPDPPPAD